MIEELLLYRVIVRRMIINRFGQTAIEVMRARDYRARQPVREIEILIGVDVMTVEEETGPWSSEKFIDLTANIAEIYVGAIGIGHICQRGAAKVDMDVRRGSVSRVQFAGNTEAELVDGHSHPPLEHHDMRRENQIISFGG